MRIAEVPSDFIWGFFVFKKLAISASFALALMSGAASAGTIDFESGSSGASIGSDYSILGVTFTNAQYKQCGGGCPVPAFGLFASSPDFLSILRVDFAALQTSISFTNVSFSSVLAQAFDSSDNLLDSVTNTQGAFVPNVETLNGPNIAYVTFQGNRAQFGIDDLVVTNAIPEPVTLSLFGAGFVGAVVMRRRKTAKRA